MLTLKMAPVSHGCFQGSYLGVDTGGITLADVRGMVVSRWNNVNVRLPEAGEGSEGNAAGGASSLFAG